MYSSDQPIEGDKVGRKITVKIELEFDEDEIRYDPETPMTDVELLSASAEMFCEDIYGLVKSNELYDVAVARATFKEEDPWTPSANNADSQ